MTSNVWTAPEIEEHTAIVAQLKKGGGGNGSNWSWEPPS
jgi:hypothetical protein